MQLQSLSVVVPNSKCMNKCKFCCSRMHCNNYKNQMNDNLPFFDLYLRQYIERLEFARHNGCNTVMLTGNSEPQQNRKFLTYFGMFRMIMQDPFQWVEMQTTGAGLDRPYLRFLRNHVGVSTISLSISALEDDINRDIIDFPKGMAPNLKQLTADIKEYDFCLRLSLNLNAWFDAYKDNPGALFKLCKEVYHADQVTLRVLYTSGNGTKEDAWIAANRADDATVQALQEYVLQHGKLLSTLPYGAHKYSVDGMSVVVDADCMGKDEDKREEPGENYKYLILQPDCRLYSQWDDSASLIF